MQKFGRISRKPFSVSRVRAEFAWTLSLVLMKQPPLVSFVRETSPPLCFWTAVIAGASSPPPQTRSHSWLTASPLAGPALPAAFYGVPAVAWGWRVINQVGRWLPAIPTVGDPSWRASLLPRQAAAFGGIFVFGASLSLMKSLESVIINYTGFAARAVSSCWLPVFYPADLGVMVWLTLGSLECYLLI